MQKLNNQQNNNTNYKTKIEMLSKIIKRSFSTSGTLLTWGETTYGWGRPINNNLFTPGAVEGFSNVTHVAAGPYHLAFLTSDSQVFTVGHGKNGRLGNGAESDAETPVKVDINGKVKQLACGLRHTLALTESGEVWAWGYGGRSPMFGCSYLGVHNPLGTGYNGSSLTPTKVSISNVSQISAGQDFSLAVSNGKVFGWGEGLKHVYHEPASLPIEFANANVLAETKQTGIKKISSVEKFAMILLENGKLYAIGRNIGGATGTRHNAKTITDNVLRILTKINDHPFHGEKIQDFEISANSLILKTNSGKVFYSGMHSKFLPTAFPAPVEAQSIWATRNSVGIIGKDGKVYFVNDPLVTDYDKSGEVMVSDEPNLKGAFKIGGSHLLRFALTH